MLKGVKWLFVPHVMRDVKRLIFPRYHQLDAGMFQADFDGMRLGLV